MPAPLVDCVRRLAVLRANGLGDLVFALPALDALRAAYPDAEIVLLAREWHRELLEGRPGPVDRVVAIPVHRGVREESDRDEDPAELERFFSARRRRAGARARRTGRRWLGAGRAKPGGTSAPRAWVDGVELGQCAARTPRRRSQ